ncbi:MAG TPA: transposase [Pirellulales bacterium]|jgi:putative transposase|nr:transposase [Pirellulales bacterium]
MPRPLRPVDDGLIYHVINRGNNRQPVFSQKGDFEAFLNSLAEIKQRKPFELYGYCLLNNHFHLLLRPKDASISRIMQSLLISHTQRYHKHHRSSGHVWQGRFKSPVIQNDEHLLAVLRYIEANPLRAKIVNRAEDYAWSSYRAHGLGEAHELLDPLRTYDELSPYPAVRQRRWAELVHAPLAEPTLAAIRRSNSGSLPYGDPNWIKRLSKTLQLDLTVRPRGRPRKTPVKAGREK